MSSGTSYRSDGLPPRRWCWCQRRASGIHFHHSRRRAAWPAQGSELERAGIRLRDTFGG